jgi:hypothetical protein
MKLKFKEFNDSNLKTTRDAWLADANAGLAFGSEIERLFDWVSNHRVPSQIDSMAFGVFPDKSNVATGICEVTIQRKSIRSRWVKMLRLHLKPSADEALQTGDSDLAMLIFTECLSGTIGLQLKHKANTLKVYGRTHEQLAFLKVLVSHIDRNIKNKPDMKVKAEIEGRFLSITIS